MSAPAAWIARYGRAWQTGDEHEVADLFAVDALYRSQVFRDPHVGRDVIRAYRRRGAGRSATSAPASADRSSMEGGSRSSGGRR